MKEKYLLSVLADSSPGLLSRVIIMLTRRRIEMDSVNMAKTDINSVVLITIEIAINTNEIKQLQLQIEKIIEVIKTDAVLCRSVVNQKLAFFKLSNNILELPQGAVIQKYGAQIINLYPDAFVISKAGSETVISELYNKLEGKYLLGFAQTGMLVDSSLLDGNDEWRISRLAA
ncbi:MAG: hypothetical protein JWQ79_1693 [Mucilaginibacter sp.]|nr:hypothetical protein [Mucilaginibacter sp.]